MSPMQLPFVASNLQDDNTMDTHAHCLLSLLSVEDIATTTTAGTASLKLPSFSEVGLATAVGRVESKDAFRFGQ